MLALDESGNQRRPFHTSIDLDRTALGIERTHLAERAQVDQQRVGPELLAAHRMAAAAQRDGRTFGCGSPDGRLHVRGRARRHDAHDLRLVQL